MLQETVVIWAVLAVASASLAVMPLQPIPEKFKGQTGCYIKELDAVIPFGKSATSTQGCVKYSCGEKIVNIEGCSHLGTSPPCKLVTDPKKPFPNCCPKVACP